MPIDLNAVAKMARDSADKEGVLTGFDQLLIGKERVRIDIPLRDTVMLAKHLDALEGWTNALDAKREFERQSPGNSTKAWDRLFYAVEAAETEARAALTLYREAGR